MTKRSLVILSVLALLVPAACKSGEKTDATAPASNAAAAAKPGSTSDMGTQATAASKPKPKGEKLVGQKVEGGTFSMTVPTGWKKSETPAKAGAFEGVFAYETEKDGAYAEVFKATFPFSSVDEDRKAVWASVQEAVKNDWSSDAVFGENYESNDGFSYNATYKGKKMADYVYFARKGDTVYYVDAGGDTTVATTEKDSWSIIESFEVR